MITTLILSLLVVLHQDTYRWQKLDEGEYALYKNGSHIGNYRIHDDVYMPWNAQTRKFGQREEPPIAPPLRNFGIVRDKLTKGEAKYSIGGHPASRDRVIEAITRDGLADDTNRLRLTIIGEEKSRKKVIEDLTRDPELSRYRSWLLVQHYPKGHRMVQGFHQDGEPVIYLTHRDGTVLWRQDDARDYQGLVAALRKADPNYDPKKDPGPWLKMPNALAKVPPWGWVVGGILIFLLARRESK